jgi:DNA polymerase I-like protein with 3'-5' exonuclease and polymerase domains
MLHRLKGQGFDASSIRFMGCVPSSYDGDFGKADLRDAREHFAESIRGLDCDGILAMGNESLFVVLGHSGIMKWRGTAEHAHGCVVVPTIALGAIERNPSQIQLLYADMRSLYASVYGAPRNNDAKPAKIRLIKDERSLEEFGEETRQATAVSFDLETSSFNELADDSFIVCAAFTLLLPDGTKTCWALPLKHKKSPCQTNWDSILRRVCRYVSRVPVRIAHNAKFDCRWLVQFGAPVPCNFDTMLASHLLDENRFKGLKPLAQMLLDAAPWSIDIASGKNAPPWYTQHSLTNILRYCALDTWHTMRLYQLFHPQLSDDKRLHALFTKLIMPASQSLVHIERRGVFVHQEALFGGAEHVANELSRIHDALMQYVPEGISGVNFNPSNFLRWFLFDHLSFPILKMGKVGPSVSESVLSHLADTNPHPVLELLQERVKWQKFQSSFFNPYRELITDESRLHTTFKLQGTVTGRLSSGKADSDKVTGSRKAALRGINLQQVPRDPLVRGVFGAAPGWAFIEADYSQIELRVAAEISGEPTLRALYAQGQDVHMTMAMRMTGKPASKVTKEERKKAKAVVFGYLYGMGARKFISTAWDNYGLRVTIEEAEASRAAFFQQFPQLLKWHAQQRRLAHRNQRVQSPLGRIRHLPDIVSRDKGVVGEAERQAINSPVQAMASDLCLLSLVLLDRKFRKAGLKAAPIGTVHDAINFECPHEELKAVVPMIKDTMENAPILKLFGFDFSVPIVVDIAAGKAWGQTTEVPDSAFDDMEGWLDEQNW